MKESKLYEIGEWLNTQGYDIDLKDCFWMEDCIFGEHKIRDIAEMLFAYEHRNDTVISDGMLSVHHLMKIHPEISHEQAEQLLKFCGEHTIWHTECYGDGSIMFPMWQEANKK